MSDPFSSFRCPICGDGLKKEEKSLRCPKGHCYDYAKSGYVNLLMSQQGGLHGDDRPMVRARTAFLEAGYYKPLLNAMLSLIDGKLPDNPKIMDAGCGEGWYTQSIHDYFSSCGKSPETVGVDISRDALTVAAKRRFGAEFAVASLFHVPLADGWADLILNVFAPDCMEEYHRILSSNGLLLKVVPGEDHLIELKSAVYDSVYKNEVVYPSYDGFVLAESQILDYTLKLPDRDTVKNLFAMTPYGRKTSPEDLAKLETVETLETTASFHLLLYRKI